VPDHDLTDEQRRALTHLWSEPAILLSALALLLTACGTPQTVQSDPERDAENAEMGKCLARETSAVAPQPVDLETATLAVMTRCHYGETRERALVAAYPEYRNYIHGLMQRQYREMADSVKGQIAVARTRGTGN
jgi:hypothetical protein